MNFFRNFIDDHPVFTIFIFVFSAYFIGQTGLIENKPIILIWGILFFYSIINIIKNYANKNSSPNNFSEPENAEEYSPLTNEELSKIDELTHSPTSYSESYERKYLMSLNEKAQFRKLQQWAQNRGLIVFSKVRLLDLIQPRKDIQNFKSALWKIQAKHIDFLICDQDIRIKCIVEINDNSHNRSDRIERDKFVTEVLQACGYKVLQTYNVTDSQLDEICGFKQNTTI